MSGERDSDCVEFSPHITPLPYKSSAENATIAALELANAIKNSAPNDPFSKIGDKQMKAITTLSNIFSNITAELTLPSPSPPPQTKDYICQYKCDNKRKYKFNT